MIGAVPNLSKVKTKCKVQVVLKDVVRQKH